MIPQPYFALIDTTKDGLPAVVVVNSALVGYDDLELFPWHLKITVDCNFLGENGMPTSSEVKVLDAWEDFLSGSLGIQKNTLFLARITWNGVRDLLFRVHDPEIVDGVLRELISVEPQVREWRYRMEHDPDWGLAKPEFQLLIGH